MSVCNLQFSIFNCFFFLCLAPIEAAAPPPPKPEGLNAASEALNQAASAGRFEEAARAARRLHTLRERWQGKSHPQTIDARFEALWWELLASTPLRSRRTVVQGLDLLAEGRELRQRGRFADAEVCLRRSLALLRRVLGDAHPGVALACNGLGDCLMERGQPSGAQPLYEKALGISRQAQGENHPATARSTNNLAACLKAQGQLFRAVSLYEQALVICEQTLGDKHPSTASCCTNLGLCQGALGRHAQALPLLRKALAIQQSARGEEHAETALACNNLALCLMAQGQHAKALPLLEKALQINRQALGEQHPRTALARNNLAGCLQALDRHDRALRLYEEALAIAERTLGEDHPTTALACNNVAACLDALGRHARAQSVFEKALAIRRKALGEDHPDTATSWNNVAACLDTLGHYARAQRRYEKALAIRRKKLGEEHPDTAISFNNLALCLDAQGRYAQALPLFRKALAVRRKVLGEEHPDTAIAYNNLAMCLNGQGRQAAARLLYEKALAIARRARGEEHLDTAACSINLASCLNSQGLPGTALPLAEKALAIHRKVLGEQHPRTAIACNGVAMCLQALGRHDRALPFFEKALAIRRRTLGDKHPLTSVSYSRVACCLRDQGRLASAQELLEKALAIRQAALGAEHPYLGACFADLGACLGEQGKYPRALACFEKALALDRRALGEEHPCTALSEINVAVSRWKLGRLNEALHLLQASLPGQETVRFHAAASGFDRALAARRLWSPHELLAVGLAHHGQPRNASRHVEAGLARGLLDDLAAADQADRDHLQALSAHLEALDDKLLPLLGRADLSESERVFREAITAQRRAAFAELARLAAAVSARQVLSLERIQEQLPVDAALVCWPEVDYLEEHWGWVLRRTGPPVWVRLPGSGKGGTWTAEDRSLAGRFYQSLIDSGPPSASRAGLARALRKQRLQPLEPHLKGARRLLVVPAGRMALVPLEVLSHDYTIAYVPSGSLLARLKRAHRPLAGSPALALGDPLFTEPLRQAPVPPRQGLLIKAVLPNGPADRAGLRPGDVLLSYAGKRLETIGDLRPSRQMTVKAVCWRQGVQLSIRLDPGNPDAVFDARSAPAALRAWRALEAAGSKRGGPVWPRLPGTRHEVETLAALVPRCTRLVGGDASEQALHRLASSGQLKTFRILHLGTHGRIDLDRPERSFLALARDRLPAPAENATAARRGGRVFTGELSVRTILDEWDLDADLVVLSACRTALGPDARGDGLLGFAQALLHKGARSVLLARWEVEDTATTLLMDRFYRNLLGRRPGLKQPLGRAPALAEAQDWLRTRTRQQARTLLGQMTPGALRGPIVAGKTPARPMGKDDRPYAEPFYWAGFVLIGDPD